MISIVLLGPPGSGKGTQADLICKKFSMCHVSTGEALRQAILKNTLLGMKIKESIESGHLVPDDVMMDLVKEVIHNNNCSKCFLLDGFPRTLSQAKLLKEMNIKVDFIIYLKVSDEIILDRLSGRRYHPGSGRIYHVKYNPPKVVGLDDLSNEPLIIRTDDREQIIRHRLSVYHKITEEIIDYYQQEKPEGFLELDGSLEKEEIFNQIVHFITLIKKV